MRSPFFHLALAAIVFAVPSHALAQSKTQRPTISLFQSNDRVLVMLTIGDNPPLPAVFDTGTNGNVIDMGVAEKLGLENRGGSRSIDGSTGKPVPGFETFIADASLGGTPIQDARATAMAFNHPNEVAIIGPNSFPGQYVMMDLAKSRLTLFAPDEAPKAGEGFPYLGHDGAALLSLDIQVEGRAIAAILDTGNNSDFLLPLSMADDLPLEAAPVVIGRAVSAAGAQDVYEARLASDVSVAGLTIPHPRIRFIAGGPSQYRHAGPAPVKADVRSRGAPHLGRGEGALRALSKTCPGKSRFPESPCLRKAARRNIAVLDFITRACAADVHRVRP